MLKNLLLLLCSFIFIVSCSSSNSPELPADLREDVSDLDDEIFETEGDDLDLNEGFSEDELDVASEEEEFEDPSLSLAATDDEFSSDELDLDEDELDLEDEVLVSDADGGEELDLDEDLNGELDDELDVAENELDIDDDFSDELDGEFDVSSDGFNEDFSDELDSEDDLEISAGDDLDDLDESELDLGDDDLELDELDDVASSESFDDLSDDEVEFSDEEFGTSNVSINEDFSDDFENVSIDDDLLVSDDVDISGDELELSEEELSNKVLSVDYDSSSTGGMFVVQTKEPVEYNTEFIPETNQFIVELKSALIDKSLQRPFLTKDFKQNFGALNSYQDSEGDAKIVIQLKNNLTPFIKRTGNRLSIVAGQEGVAAEEAFASAEKSARFDDAEYAAEQKKKALNSTSLEDYLLENTSYYGKPISIQVKDADIVDVIHLISEEVGANLVVSQAVSGKVSIKLKEVPWDQALITIMKTRGLGYIRSGSVLRIAPLSELQAESQAASAVQNARKSLTPYHVKVFPLSYASPETLEGKLKPFLSAASNDGGIAGQIISEKRSSSIIVNDTKDVIQNISKLIKELDRPPLQVMIEAKVVEATKEFTKQFGSGLSTSPSTQSTAGADLVATNGFNWNGGLQSNVLSNTLSVSGLNFFGNLTHSLRLNELERKIKVLSAPKILAMNNEQATILQVSQVLNQTTTVEEGEAIVTAEAIDVELRLEVTPQITSDSNVIMDLLVRRQFPGTNNAELGATPINSREAKTKVIVGNNRTAVIGGIYQVDQNDEKSGIPIVRKVPILSWLFGNKSLRKVDSELMVFVTPRILNRKGRLTPVGKTPVAASESAEAF